MPFAENNALRVNRHAEIQSLFRQAASAVFPLVISPPVCRNKSQSISSGCLFPHALADCLHASFHRSFQQE
jgi:hypothetical protein